MLCKLKFTLSGEENKAIGAVVFKLSNILNIKTRENKEEEASYSGVHSLESSEIKPGKNKWCILSQHRRFHSVVICCWDSQQQ